MKEEMKEGGEICVVGSSRTRKIGRARERQAFFKEVKLGGGEKKGTKERKREREK